MSDQKKPKAITSKTIKNMMSQLTEEAYGEVERVYEDWLSKSQKIAPMIDNLTSSSLKKMLKSVIVPEYDKESLSFMEKEASELLTEIMDLRIELFVVSAFLNKPENKKNLDMKND